MMKIYVERFFIVVNICIKLKSPDSCQGINSWSGEGGIRTHGTLLTYTRFPSVRLKPLGHLSRYN